MHIRKTLEKIFTLEVAANYREPKNNSKIGAKKKKPRSTKAKNLRLLMGNFGRALVRTQPKAN